METSNTIGTEYYWYPECDISGRSLIVEVRLCNNTHMMFLICDSEYDIFILTRTRLLLGSVLSLTQDCAQSVLVFALH